MTAIGIPANAKQLAALVKEGEGPTLEFKRSTGGRHDSKPVNPLTDPQTANNRRKE